VQPAGFVEAKLQDVVVRLAQQRGRLLAGRDGATCGPTTSWRSSRAGIAASCRCGPKRRLDVRLKHKSKRTGRPLSARYQTPAGSRADSDGRKPRRLTGRRFPDPIPDRAPKSAFTSCGNAVLCLLTCYGPTADYELMPDATERPEAPAGPIRAAGCGSTRFGELWVEATDDVSQCAMAGRG
jgi:hypothetical protein